MSSGPVARWLETFVCNSMCRQYVEVFQEFGYNNLNEICNLNSQQLLKMGVSMTDTEKIIDNVSVLKQTMQANVINNSQNYPAKDNQLDSLSCNYDSSIITTNFESGKLKRIKPIKTNSMTPATTEAKQKHLVPNVTMNQDPKNNNSQHPLLISINNTNSTTPIKKNKTKNNKNNKNQIDKNSESIGITSSNSQILNSKLNITNNNNGSNNINKANPEAAKKIGNEILNIANISQSNTKYNCLSISNSNSPINHTNNLNYEFQQNQFQLQQQQILSQYRNYQKSPTTLLSPISNPSSTSSSNSSNQFYSQHSPPSLSQQLQMQSLSSENGYGNSNKQHFYQQQQQYYDMNPYNNTHNNSTSEYYSNCNVTQLNNSSINGYNNNISNTCQYSNQNIYSSGTFSNSNPQFANNTNLMNTNMNGGGIKNSPLEYLERLALLPECQVVDPKSIVSNEINNNANCNNENIISNQIEKANSYDLNDMETAKLNNKRNSNDMPDLSSPLQSNNKKTCNSSNYKANMSQQLLRKNYQNNKINSQFNLKPGPFTNELENDLLSNDLCLHATNSNDNQNLSNNIIDACNFDFLDYLPELNSTTIDQTIKTATLSNFNSSIGLNDNQVDEIAYSETIYNL